MLKGASPPAILTACDREPIHILGAIQPFGFLLSVNADWLVARASENVEKFTGVAHAQVVGQSAESCLSPTLLHEIRSRLQVAGGMGVVERLYDQRLRQGGARFDIAIHQSGREVVLEFEPSSGEPKAPIAILRTMALRVERQTTLTAVYREVARQVRGLTGFDRVMVYRFDEDGAGEVVAEAVNHGLPPYMGLRYPASDIPAQARALYEKNYLRIIVDIDAAPVSIIPTLSREGDPLDLTMSGLRSVSPTHIEYLRNMGVQTSMSISVLQGGKLWGLIACHHGTTRKISLEVRSTAELFGQMFSYLLDSRERQLEAEHDVRASEVHNRIAIAFSDPAASLKDIPEFISGVGDFISADGIGVFCAGEINLSGITPTKDEFLDLVRFLNKTASGRVFSTHSLAEIFPHAADSLHDLLRFEIATYSELESRLILVGPDVLLPPKSFTAMALVVHELVTNARKYGALSASAGIVTVETSIDKIHNILVSWRESGGPAVLLPTRRGFGSTLIEQLIPFEMNGMSKPQFLAAGFVLDVLLPAAMAEAVQGATISGPVQEAALTATEEKALIHLLRTCLVVEDNLFIALDAEDMLRSIGADKVIIANSIAEARTAISSEKFSFALLDVNLGSDNSLPIARTLIASGVPFAFGTGYGEALALPDAMTSTPIVSKPYHRIALMKAFIGMVRRKAELPVAESH